MTTANQMMRRAEQTVMAQQFHDTACNSIPGRTVIVVAETDGLGKVEIVAMPGRVGGQGGTADVLATALREIGGYDVAPIPVVSVIIPAKNSHSGAAYRRDMPVEPAVAEIVRRLNHPVHGDEAFTVAACGGHGETWPSVHLQDGDVLLKMPALAATAMLQMETARRSGLPYEVAGLDQDVQAMYRRVMAGLGLGGDG